MKSEQIEKINALVKENPAYQFEAYLFVLSALGLVLKKMEEKRHITGQELLDGIRTLGAELYGRLALEVFHHWGINSTLDFGRIVFALVKKGILRKREEDSLDDFRDVFDFEETFIDNYELPCGFKS